MDSNTRMEMAADMTRPRRPYIDNPDSDLWILKCIQAQTSEVTQNDPGTKTQNHESVDHVITTT
jgi:hypothetical protein